MSRGASEYPPQIRHLGPLTGWHRWWRHWGRWSQLDRKWGRREVIRRVSAQSWGRVPPRSWSSAFVFTASTERDQDEHRGEFSKRTDLRMLFLQHTSFLLHRASSPPELWKHQHKLENVSPASCHAHGSGRYGKNSAPLSSYLCLSSFS